MREGLETTAREVRRMIIEQAFISHCSHIGSCLSCVDLLTALYFETMRLDPWEERDLFVMSKGHAALALYATLARREIIPLETLRGYYLNEGTLPAHLDRFTAKGIEVSTGSLGHGFNMGLGMAYELLRKQSPRRVFALLGDGETEEGSIWEGAMFAARHKIGNFTALVDCNDLQGYGRPNELCAHEPLADKWRAFGWETQEIDGNDMKAVCAALAVPVSDKPKVILARTIKGKGVSFMEDKLIWHYYFVTEEVRQQALKELA
jgi:transketolase